MTQTFGPGDRVRASADTGPATRTVTMIVDTATVECGTPNGATVRLPAADLTLVATAAEHAAGVKAAQDAYDAAQAAANAAYEAADTAYRTALNDAAALPEAATAAMNALLRGEYPNG